MYSESCLLLDVRWFLIAGRCVLGTGKEEKTLVVCNCLSYKQLLVLS